MLGRLKRRRLERMYNMSYTDSHIISLIRSSCLMLVPVSL
jgi:hypothetical protein